MAFLSLAQSFVLMGMGIILTSTTTEPDVIPGVTTVVNAVAEFGIMIVISAVMITITWRMTNNIIKRDNKLYDEMAPKLTSLQTDLANNVYRIENVLKDIDRNITTAVSNHNAHSNQSHKSMEKDMQDIRDMLLQNQDTLRDISSQLTVLNTNVETINKMMMHNIYGKRDGETA